MADRCADDTEIKADLVHFMKQNNISYHKYDAGVNQEPFQIMNESNIKKILSIMTGKCIMSMYYGVLRCIMYYRYK